MRIVSATVGPLAAASATAIAASQSGVIGTPLTLTSTPFKMDTPRRLGITSVGNDSGITFTIIGSDWNSAPVKEVLTGANATVAQSLYDYATVASITPSANTASTVTVGTTAVASTRPVFLDEWAFPQVAIQVNATGTVNATVQQSLDDPNQVGYTAVNWVNHPDTALVGLTATVQGNYAYAPKVVRLLLNSGTGSAKINLSQAASVVF